MKTESTNSRLRGRLPELVSIKRVRPTNSVSIDVQGRPFTPILLVGADDGLYYIVDGNHRFFRKLVLGQSHETILAWILEEGDQQRVEGNPLPQHVREWQKGQITLAQLSMRAKASHKSIEREVRKTLEHCGVLAAEKNGAKSSSNADQRAYALAEAVVRLIMGVSTIEQEALHQAVPIEEMASLHKCFLDGGIRAIRDRLISG